MLDCDWQRCLQCGLGRFIYRMDDEKDDDLDDDGVDEVEETYDVIWDCKHHHQPLTKHVSPPVVSFALIYRRVPSPPLRVDHDLFYAIFDFLELCVQI